jgi:hypothetical protein
LGEGLTARISTRKGKPYGKGQQPKQSLLNAAQQMPDAAQAPAVGESSTLSHTVCFSAVLQQALEGDDGACHAVP